MMSPAQKIFQYHTGICSQRSAACPAGSETAFYNGFHWCEEIRRISQVPIIFISSASDNMNMVMAMSRGADDFIAKPFDLDVLTAKIQAILRRTYPSELREMSLNIRVLS